MEPRPSRPNRPASSASRAQRGVWVPPEGTDDLTAPRNAELYGPASPSGTPSGGPWYGPHGSLGPEPPEYRATKPPMPIKPRGERGNKWLRYLLAAGLLALVVGGSAFAITWFLDDDDDNDPAAQEQNEQALVTETPQSSAETPVATQTPETLAEPTATSEAPAEPTAITEADQAAPTEESASTTQEEENAAAAEAEEGTTDSAADYLPTVDDLDGAWTVQAEGDRPIAEVGVALGEGGEEVLRQFGWQENVYRDFVRESAPEETFFVSVSVHSFDSAEGASEALTYFSDVLAGVGIYQTAPVVDVGDATVALEGAQDGYNLYALYVLDDNVMIRFGGSSQTGDPAPYVNAVAEDVLAAAA